ncbi:hypothetical protein [Ottowia sp.]|uniref:hypothetical protein n=1 Tax=Ottowia sp. TaxID=1898956 RepID=UPI002CCB3611|nr:hypothetical protein [Ottowia sp.]HOB65831.1 hypothetical protein [Ottowia sp.]HPZ57140.1 hypothetical protein [Ottowia sp.]HQD46805.1 hypothetical protein [Ottowia sp.]
MNSNMAIAPALTPVQTMPTDGLKGRAVFEGRYCEYGEYISADDVVLANFDQRRVTTGGGLYVVQSIKDGQPAWTGCRYMMRQLSGIVVNEDGRKNWQHVPDLDATKWVVVGTVEAVYRPRHYADHDVLSDSRQRVPAKV